MVLLQYFHFRHHYIIVIIFSSYYCHFNDINNKNKEFMIMTANRKKPTLLHKISYKKIMAESKQKKNRNVYERQTDRDRKTDKVTANRNRERDECF